MKLTHFYIIVFLYLLSGCTTLYIPSPKNIPLLEEKGEVQVEVGVSTNSIFATGSYAFSEKYAFIANSAFSFYNFSDFSDLGDLRSYGELTILSGGAEIAHRSVEAGFGRFNILPESKRCLEAFVGVGYSVGNFDDKDYNNRYINGFFQINTNKKHKKLEIGWSFSCNYVYFNFKHPDYYNKKNKEEIIYSKFSLIQPGALFFMRFGSEHLKLTIRNGINLAFPLSSNCPIKTNSFETEHTVFHISMGLCYSFKI